MLNSNTDALSDQTIEALADLMAENPKLVSALSKMLTDDERRRITSSVRCETANPGRSKLRNQRRIEFLRSTANGAWRPLPVGGTRAADPGLNTDRSRGSIS